MIGDREPVPGLRVLGVGLQHALEVLDRLGRLPLGQIDAAANEVTFDVRRRLLEDVGEDGEALVGLALDEGELGQPAPGREIVALALLGRPEDFLGRVEVAVGGVEVDQVEPRAADHRLDGHRGLELGQGGVTIALGAIEVGQQEVRLHRLLVAVERFLQLRLGLGEIARLQRQLGQADVVPGARLEDGTGGLEAGGRLRDLVLASRRDGHDLERLQVVRVLLEDPARELAGLVQLAGQQVDGGQLHGDVHVVGVGLTGLQEEGIRAPEVTEVVVREAHPFDRSRVTGVEAQDVLVLDQRVLVAALPEVLVAATEMSRALCVRSLGARAEECRSQDREHHHRQFHSPHSRSPVSIRQIVP